MKVEDLCGERMPPPLPGTCHARDAKPAGPRSPDHACPSRSRPCVNARRKSASAYAGCCGALADDKGSVSVPPVAAIVGSVARRSAISRRHAFRLTPFRARPSRR